MLNNFKDPLQNLLVIGRITDFENFQTYKQMQFKLWEKLVQMIYNDMQSTKDEDKRRQHTKNTNYLSEYQTYESSTHNQIFKKNQSANMLRKLKRLWNRQRYLTDDQYETTKDVKSRYFLEDSSMDNEVDESMKSLSYGKQESYLNNKNKKAYHVKKHQRVVSSSDQQLNVPHKMKTKDSQLQVKLKQNICMGGQVQELASISSAFQDQSQERVNR